MGRNEEQEEGGDTAQVEGEEVMPQRAAAATTLAAKAGLLIAWPIC